MGQPWAAPRGWESRCCGSGGPQSEQDPWGRQGKGKVWAGPATGKASRAAGGGALCSLGRCGGSHGDAAGPVDGTGDRQVARSPWQGRDRWSRVNSKKQKPWLPTRHLEIHHLTFYPASATEAMETAPPFLFLLYIAPRLPPALSLVQGPSPSAVSDPFPTAARNPSSRPLSPRTAAEPQASFLTIRYASTV